MCDKAEQDPEATTLTSSPASGSDERQGSYPEPVDTLGSSPVEPERTGTPNPGTSCGNETSPSPNGEAEKPQFYIEVDASSMVSLKAGTHYTLVPLDSDQAAAAAIPTSGSIAQSLAWGRTLDGRLPGDESAGNPRAVSKEELTGESFGLDQGMMSSFDATSVAPGKAEEPDTPLDAEFEESEEKMTYTPLMTVSQQQQQQEQQAQAHEATAAAAAAAQMQHATGGFDGAAMRYRHPTSPLYVAPPQHALQHQTTTPFLVHQRGSWAPYTATTAAQASMTMSECCSTGMASEIRGSPAPVSRSRRLRGQRFEPRSAANVQLSWASQVRVRRPIRSGYMIHGPSLQGYAPCPHQITAYLPLPTTSHSGAAASAAASIAGDASSSSGGATAADSGLHTTLGADEVASAGDYGRSATGEASGSDIMSGVARVANMGQIQHMVGPLDNVPYYMPFNGRENHNEKERKRRTRIKNACQTLRSLVPGLSDKTDKATVFEFTVQYLLHLRRHLGTKQDKSISQEFMEKYSPY